LDKFAADLVGKLDRIEVTGASRWVRQGQRLATLHAGSISLDLVSPVEGVIMDINKDVLEDPTLTSRDPYKNGWIAVLKSPDLPTNQKNLLQGSMVGPWMHYNVTRLNSALAKANPGFAQDGGVPVSQALEGVDPELREKLAKDFLLN
jgi:glycine cleavage system H lipoate-binding protein